MGLGADGDALITSDRLGLQLQQALTVVVVEISSVVEGSPEDGFAATSTHHLVGDWFPLKINHVLSTRIRGRVMRRVHSGRQRRVASDVRLMVLGHRRDGVGIVSDFYVVVFGHSRSGVGIVSARNDNAGNIGWRRRRWQVLTTEVEVKEIQRR